jgi:hypothetical protein
MDVVEDQHERVGPALHEQQAADGVEGAEPSPHGVESLPLRVLLVDVEQREQRGKRVVQRGGEREDLPVAKSTVICLRSPWSAAREVRIFWARCLGV